MSEDIGTHFTYTRDIILIATTCPTESVITRVKFMSRLNTPFIYTLNSPQHAQIGSDSRTAVRNCCSRRHTLWRGESPIWASHFGRLSVRWLDTAMHNTRAETSLVFAIFVSTVLAYWGIVNSCSSKIGQSSQKIWEWDLRIWPWNLTCESISSQLACTSLVPRRLSLRFLDLWTAWRNGSKVTYAVKKTERKTAWKRGSACSALPRLLRFSCSILDLWTEWLNV